MGEIRKVEKTGDEGQRRERERDLVLHNYVVLLCDSSRYFFLKGGEDESDGRDTRTTVQRLIIPVFGYTDAETNYSTGN